MQTTTATDPLVERLAKQVTDLADGNGITRDAIQVTGTRADRPMSLLLEVGFGWVWSSRTLPGALQVEGSRHCDDEAGVAAHLKLRCNALIAEPATAEVVAKLVRAAPYARFADLADEFEVEVGRVHGHHHSGCRRCGTKGTHRCPSLLCGGVGTTPCYCNDGKVSCGSCSYGTVYYTESYYDTNTRATAYVSRQRTCSNCGGSGRTGTCWSCGGTSRIQCATCRGDGWVYCSPCGASGWFTVATDAWVIGKPKRSRSFPADAPASFIEGVRLLPVRAIHGEHAETRLKSAEAKGSRVLAVFDCAMPHVSLAARFGNVLTQPFNAFGKKATVVLMPTFLDDLLAPVGYDISSAVAAGNMAEALRLGQSTRVTKDILRMVGGHGESSADELLSRYSNAISPGTISDVRDHLAKAYIGVARVSVQRAWLVLGLPVVVAALALPLAEAGRSLLDVFPGIRPDSLVDRIGVGIAANLAMTAVAVVTVWLLAARRAKRVVKAVVGEDARSRPGQGWWPPAFMAAALAVCLGGSAANGSLGILFEPSWRAEARSQTIPLPGRPPWTPDLEPAPGRLRGAPEVYRTQFLLAQLGFYRGEPDGVADFATREATAKLMHSVPQDALGHRFGAHDFDIARAAVRGEFRLVSLPADKSPAAYLSNVSRAMLTAEDIDRMNRAASAAAANVGRDQTWRSADGKHGGGVKAVRPPTAQRCVLLELNVAFGERSERGQPEVFCLTGTKWVPL